MVKVGGAVFAILLMVVGVVMAAEVGLTRKQDKYSHIIPSDDSILGGLPHAFDIVNAITAEMHRSPLPVQIGWRAILFYFFGITVKDINV